VLNLLHLLAVLAMAGCLDALWREARGISQSRGHLMVPPPLAFACVLVMIGLTDPDLQQPDVLRTAIAAGVLLGAARGWFMAVDIDPLWSTVRLPSGSDGLRHGRRGVRCRLPVGAGSDGLFAHPQLTFPASPPLLH
jgi:hypothetical protein